jgi:IS30 family transposase
MTGLRLTAEQRGMIRRLWAEGLSLRQVARQVSCSHEGVRFVLGGHRSRWTPWAWQPGQGRLSAAEREEISLGVHRGQTFSAIASRLGRAVSTVSREVAANGGRGGYRAWRAHERAWERARRAKVPKLACERLAAQVRAWLEEWWSPQEIARRLRVEFPADPMTWVSHETIYQALFV